MFKLQNVVFGYERSTLVINNLNFRICKGDYLLIKGPSGSGKSTFLRLLNGLLEPQQGSIFFYDRPLAGYNYPELRRRVVYLQQIPVMLNASIKDNLCLPFRFRVAQKVAPPNDEVIREYLHFFGLDALKLDANAGSLSVGQKQRLALIRALLLNPEVLLLDEPTASLDAEAREVVEEYLEKLNLEKGTSIIFISHGDYLPRRVKARFSNLEQGQLREVF